MMQRIPRWLSGLALAILFPPVGVSAADTPVASIPITIADRAGVSRDGELVTFGIPLPREWQVADPAALQLADETGASVPVQFQVLGRWGAAPGAQSAPVKWLLVNCRQSVPANGQTVLSLQKGAAASLPKTRLTVDSSHAGRLTVDTGAATFDINTDSRFNLLEQVTVGGQPLLQALPPRDAIAYRFEGHPLGAHRPAPVQTSLTMSDNAAALRLMQG